MRKGVQTQLPLGPPPPPHLQSQHQPLAPGAGREGTWSAFVNEKLRIKNTFIECENAEDDIDSDDEQPDYQKFPSSPAGCSGGPRMFAQLETHQEEPGLQAFAPQVAEEPEKLPDRTTAAPLARRGHDFSTSEKLRVKNTFIECDEEDDDDNDDEQPDYRKSSSTPAASSSESQSRMFVPLEAHEEERGVEAFVTPQVSEEFLPKERWALPGGFQDGFLHIANFDERQSDYRPAAPTPAMRRRIELECIREQQNHMVANGGRLGEPIKIPVPAGPSSIVLPLSTFSRPPGAFIQQHEVRPHRPVAADLSNGIGHQVNAYPMHRFPVDGEDEGEDDDDEQPNYRLAMSSPAKYTFNFPGEQNSNTSNEPAFVPMASNSNLRAVSDKSDFSMGSAEHNRGNCHPCAHIWKPAGCDKGASCKFCHLCDKDDFKLKRKAKLNRLRAEKIRQRQEAAEAMATVAMPAAAP